MRVASAHVKLPIPGHFSVENALNALGMVLALGMPLADAAKSMATATGVKGRVEVVPTDTDYTVLIDYAHSPDGVENVLKAVRGLRQGPRGSALRLRRRPRPHQAPEDG